MISLVIRIKLKTVIEARVLQCYLTSQISLINLSPQPHTPSFLLLEHIKLRVWLLTVPLCLELLVLQVLTPMSSLQSDFSYSHF